MLRGTTASPDMKSFIADHHHNSSERSKKKNGNCIPEIGETLGLHLKRAGTGSFVIPQPFHFRLTLAISMAILRKM